MFWPRLLAVGAIFVGYYLLTSNCYDHGSGGLLVDISVYCTLIVYPIVFRMRPPAFAPALRAVSFDP